jgi:hypothetical protein
MKARYSKMWILLSLLLFSGAATAWAGPYSVSDYVDMNDGKIVAWATGWQDYTPGTNLWLEWQTPEKALGQAMGDAFDVVSLGRGGSITMTFAAPIVNGPGADFAIFENSFSDPDQVLQFLELAYVEVSSDGVNFVRFDNDSQTQGLVGGFGEAVDASNLRQLAGKHVQGRGTLFDLENLLYNVGDDASVLDLNNIGYVRLVDIVGDGTCMDTDYSQYGSPANPIYDPWPTTGSAGFDLDAIGVLNQGAAPVPVPAAVWLLGSGLLGLVGARRKQRLR